MEALDTGDGVTSVALGTASLLRELGEPGTIYARFVAGHERPGVEVAGAPEGASALARETQPCRKVLGGPEGGLLFHFWNYNTSTWMVHAVHGRRAIYFHGITPPRFFAPGSDLHRMTADGYAQLRSLVDSFDLIVGLSRDALATVCGFLHRPRPALHMYPVVEPEDCRRAPVDATLLARLKSGGDVNLVFVGRIVRNKRQDQLLRLFDRYHACNPRSRLFLVGNDSCDPGFRAELEQQRAALRAPDRVTFTGKVSERALNAYLRGADVFVCATEHEAFCLPVAHAMALDVPVVALAATAVPETLGGGGVLVGRWDASAVAEIVEQLVRDRVRRARVIARQQDALGRFSAREVRARLAAIVDYLRDGTWSPLFAWSHALNETSSGASHAGA
jgi:glycosyltransferase involved in cell wall biosynthesis